MTGAYRISATKWVGLAMFASGLLFPGAKAVVAAEVPSRPAYQIMRFDENWSPLSNAALRADPFDSIKWIPLGSDATWYATLGGEVRERFESSRNPVFGLGAPQSNDYLLQRASVFADVHYGANFRTFVEIVSGVAPSWNGTPPPTQKDEVDLLQAFADLKIPTTAGELVVRGGRQELSFGSSRLVSPREGPNVRLSFDGIRTFWVGAEGLRIDAFLVKPVAPQTGVFNDSSIPTQTFWGLYATVPLPGMIPGLKADFYYLGLDRGNASFAQGTANEHRQSVGARLFGKSNGFDWNSEAVYQFGSFGSADIRAWTVSTALGYTFAGVPLTPRIGLNADAISGDKNLHDNTLGTFNPLFPKLPYFSEANLVAPANLLDIQPNLTLFLSKSANVNFGWNPLWKQEVADAFYGPPLTAVKGTTGGGRYIGQQASATVSWAATSHLNVVGSYVHYTPGETIRQAGGRSGNFVAVWAQFLF